MNSNCLKGLIDQSKFNGYLLKMLLYTLTVYANYKLS